MWEIGRERETERELSRSVSDPEFPGLLASRRERCSDDVSAREGKMLRAEEGGRDEAADGGVGEGVWGETEDRDALGGGTGD